MRTEASEASSGREGTNQLLNYISMLVALTVCMRFCLFSSVCGRAMPFARARDEDVHQEEGQEKIQSHSRDYPNHLTVKHMPTVLCLGVLMRASCQFATKFMQTQTAQSVIPAINKFTNRTENSHKEFMCFHGFSCPSVSKILPGHCISVQDPRIKVTMCEFERWHRSPHQSGEALVHCKKTLVGTWQLHRYHWYHQFVESTRTFVLQFSETFCCDNGFVSKISPHRCIISKPPPKQSHAEAKKRNQRCTCQRVLWTPR